MRRLRPTARGVALFLAGAISATAITLAVGAETRSDNIRVTERSEGTPLIGVRPTGVGLPLVGSEGTIGAGDFAEETLHDYHDSGLYGRDIRAVASRARRYFVKKIRTTRRGAARRCARAKRDGAGADALTRACRKPKLAIVIDIDETALSNYECLSDFQFKQPTAATIVCAGQADTPPIKPTLAIYKIAIDKGVGVFFITARPEDLPMARERTEENLRFAGYTKWKEVVLAPEISLDTIAYKSGERARIEKQGYRIILNLGDQETDLQGGHADRAYKLPNPFYITGP